LDGVGVVNAVNRILANGIAQLIFLAVRSRPLKTSAKRQQRAAAAAYTTTTLQAFKQVDDALDSDYHLRRREGALNDMVTHSATVVKLGKVQLGQG
jgi:outer membrane protein TolC